MLGPCPACSSLATQKLISEAGWLLLPPTASLEDHGDHGQRTGDRMSIRGQGQQSPLGFCESDSIGTKCPGDRHRHQMCRLAAGHQETDMLPGLTSATLWGPPVPSPAGSRATWKALALSWQVEEGPCLETEHFEPARSALPDEASVVIGLDQAWPE